MTTDKHALACLALGRIFRIGARPFQEGDIEEYERCKAIIMDTAEPLAPDYRPSYTRDRLKGAQGA